MLLQMCLHLRMQMKVIVSSYFVQTIQPSLALNDKYSVFKKEVLFFILRMLEVLWELRGKVIIIKSRNKTLSHVTPPFKECFTLNTMIKSELRYLNPFSNWLHFKIEETCYNFVIHRF